MNKNSREFLKSAAWMGTSCMAAVFSFASAAVRAEAVYSYEEDGKALVVTVPEGEEATFSPEGAAVLQANSVTNFYKRGTGRLFMTSVTTNFTGHFWIQEGVLTSYPQADSSDPSSSRSNNLTMGSFASESEGGGAIHVVEGATFSVNGTAYRKGDGVSLVDKTVYFGGTGYDGNGALCVFAGEGGGRNMHNLWGRHFIMTSDAMVCNMGADYAGFPGYYGSLDMNRHTLTISSAGEGIYSVIDSAVEDNIGSIVVLSKDFNIAGNSNWFKSNEAGDNEMRFKSGAMLVLNNCSGYPNGKLVLEDGSLIQLNDAGRAGYEPGSTGGTTHRWCGEVVADTSGHIVIKGPQESSRRYVQFAGLVSGGGFRLENGTCLILGNIDNAPNTFTNGIIATDNCDVTLLWGDQLPQNGGDLVLSNASFTVQNGLTYTLPPIRCSGTCRFRGKMDNGYDHGERDKRQYYPTLQFYGGSTGQFSTNVVVTSFLGLPEICPYPADTSEEPVYPSLAVSTGPERFVIEKVWTIDTADVVEGDCLKFDGGEIKLNSGIRIDVVGDARGDSSRNGGRYKIAEADRITFTGAMSVNVEDPNRWRFSVGEDGKSLYLDYIPFGTAFILR